LIQEKPKLKGTTGGEGGGSHLERKIHQLNLAGSREKYWGKSLSMKEKVQFYGKLRFLHYERGGETFHQKLAYQMREWDQIRFKLD